MSKKTMLLAAGALAALAFMALAATAAARETSLKCEGTGPCLFSVSGLFLSFSIEGGDTIKCSSVEGNGEVTGLNAERESSTSTVQLRFIECREQNTVFHFTCSNTNIAGRITTNVMTMHNIALFATLNEAGVLVTNAGVTFTCAGGFASTQLTGSMIGEYENQCNTNTSWVQSINFTTWSDGNQTLTSYTGAFFKLEGQTTHSSGGTYADAAFAGTANLNFNQNVILTCA